MPAYRKFRETNPTEDAINGLQNSFNKLSGMLVTSISISRKLTTLLLKLPNVQTQTPRTHTSAVTLTFKKT